MRIPLLLLSALLIGPSHASEPEMNPVEEALTALRARSDVTITGQGGWTIVSDESGLTIWSFTPADHPAHPAYVERRMIQKDGAWYVRMNVQCGASKKACDKLVEEFRALNEQIREELNSGKGLPARS